MEGDPVSVSTSAAGDVPDAPSDGSLMAVTVEDGGGHPRGYFIQWKHLDEGWLYAGNPDDWVSLDDSL